VTDHEGLDTLSKDRTASNEDLSGQIQHAGLTNEDDLAAAESLTGLSTDLTLYSLPSVEPATLQAPGDQSQCNSMLDLRQHPADVTSPLPHSGRFDRSWQINSRLTVKGIEFDTQFRDFTEFLDGIGLSTEWGPFFDVSPMGGDATGNGLAAPRPEPDYLSQQAGTRAGTPFSSWLPSAPTGDTFASVGAERNGQSSSGYHVKCAHNLHRTFGQPRNTLVQSNRGTALQVQVYHSALLVHP
jgi:hypothetical protein